MRSFGHVPEVLPEGPLPVVVDGLDVVAVGIEDERPVVAGVVGGALTGRAVVLVARLDRGSVEGVDRLVRAGAVEVDSPDAFERFLTAIEQERSPPASRRPPTCIAAMPRSAWWSGWVISRSSSGWVTAKAHTSLWNPARPSKIWTTWCRSHTSATTRTCREVIARGTRTHSPKRSTFSRQAA